MPTFCRPGNHYIVLELSFDGSVACISDERAENNTALWLTQSVVLWWVQSIRVFTKCSTLRSTLERHLHRSTLSQHDDDKITVSPIWRYAKTNEKQDTPTHFKLPLYITSHCIIYWILIWRINKCRVRIVRSTLFWRHMLANIKINHSVLRS